MKIDISKKDKAAVLKALYDYARPGDIDAIFERGGKCLGKFGDLSIERARKALANTTNFSILFGRFLHVNLRGGNFDPFLYECYNGSGAAKIAVDSVPDTL